MNNDMLVGTLVGGINLYRERGTRQYYAEFPDGRCTELYRNFFGVTQEVSLLLKEVYDG